MENLFVMEKRLSELKLAVSALRLWLRLVKEYWLTRVYLLERQTKMEKVCEKSLE